MAAKGRALGRRPRRSVRAFLIATVLAAVAIAGGARYMISQFNVRTDSLADVVGGIPTSKPAAALEQQRQNIILMTVATKAFKVVGSPKVATVPVAAPAGGAPIVPSAPPNPGTAQAIAYKMLSSFGFSTNQFGCLNNIWSRESGWRYNAANASGAYGIPQALPGSKMASAGADWLTNPATQIKWGLGYIKSVYGTPCNAWVFWQGHSWY
ncbi:MAG TPA: lytic transglycosylase domain-containing protein [Streptosporangiaceae bacterium]|nr:lytic transglycosylase domain-containing protein [Streptosporangiaceae bacterium]